MPRAQLSNMFVLALVAFAAGGCKQRALRVVDANPTTLTSLDFGTLPVGGKKTLTIPIDNSGAAPLRISSAAVAAPFAVDGPPPDAIGPGSRGYLMVAFEPSAAGDAATSIVINTNSFAFPTLSVELQGSAFAADLVADPPRLDFGDVAIGSYRTLTVRLRNQTLARLNPTVEQAGSTDFTASPIGALDQVKPNGASTIDVTFAPTALGTASGSLSYTCATCPTKQIELTGTGTGAAGDGGPIGTCTLSVSPARLDFGSVAAGSTSSATVDVRSTGGGICVLARPFFDSTTDAAFSSPSLQSMVLQPGASTTVRVDLKPVATTSPLVSGALVFNSNDPQQPAQRVALSASVTGTQVAGRLAVSPTSLSYTGPIGQAFAPQDVRLSNTGNATLSWTASSDDASVRTSSTSGSLAPGGLAAVSVTVGAQSVAGTRVQHLTIDAGAAGKATVAVSITVTEGGGNSPAQLAVLPTFLSFVAVPGTAPKAQAFTVRNLGSAGQLLSWTASADDGAISLAPGSGALDGGGATAVLVSVAAQNEAGERTRSVVVNAGAAGTATVTIRIVFTAAAGVPPYGISAWPKFHRDNALTGRSAVDTSVNAGRVRWKAFVGAPAACTKIAGGVTRCGTYLNSPVLGEDGSVIQLGGDGKLRFFDRADGTLKWATMTAPPSHMPQESTPMVLNDGSIFLGTGSASTAQPRFWRIDRNGNVLWSSTCGGGCQGWSSSPAVAADAALYMSNAPDAAVDSIDLQGRSVRRVNLTPRTPIETMSGALANDGNSYWSANGNFYVTSAGGLLASYVNPFNAEGEYARRAAPALMENGLAISVYQYANGGGIFSSRVYSFQPGAAGGGPYWHFDMPRSAGIRGFPSGTGLSASDEDDAQLYRSGASSPAISADGTIYIGHADGIYALVNEDTGSVQHGRIVWSLRTGQIFGSPAVGADGRVYFGSVDGFLYAVKDGELVWQVRTRGQVNSSPAIGADGTVYAVSDDGYLYAVR